MSLITLPSLPDPILHLICVYLTPDRPTVNDAENGHSPTLYRSIISLSLTSHSINRISSIHIAANISLTDCCVRWDLFLRTVTTNATYASNVKYLKLSEGTQDEWLTRRPTKSKFSDDVCGLFEALSGLEALYSHNGKALYPSSIVHRLTYEELPMWNTLEVLRFDHVNVWGEQRVVQIHLVREGGKEPGKHAIEGREGNWSTGNELLTGELKGLPIGKLGDLPGVDHVEITSVDGENDGDATSDSDWVDTDDEDEYVEDQEDDWSERDYEEDSGESDWDSEDSSDYEDDWEAEWGVNLPNAGPLKDIETPPSDIPVHTIGILKF